MLDIEKVIKGLLCCIDSDRECFCPEDCPYGEVNESNYMCETLLKLDAIALLKGQKDMLDHIVEFKKGDVVRAFDCPFCHTQYRLVMKHHEAILCNDCDHYTSYGSSGICGSWGEWCDPDEWCSRAIKRGEKV